VSFSDDWNAVVQHPAVAGVVGSLLSLRWVPGNSWGERFFSFGCGMGVVLFLVPAAIGYMEVKAAWAGPAFGFMGGILGINLVGKSVDYVKNAEWGALLDLLRGRKQ
jgi:hypothetical protein